MTLGALSQHRGLRIREAPGLRGFFRIWNEPPKVTTSPRVLFTSAKGGRVVERRDQTSGCVLMVLRKVQTRFGAQ